jgi:hypothetical protein
VVVVGADDVVVTGSVLGSTGRRPVDPGASVVVEDVAVVGVVVRADFTL